MARNLSQKLLACNQFGCPNQKNLFSLNEK